MKLSETIETEIERQLTKPLLDVIDRLTIIQTIREARNVIGD